MLITSMARAFSRSLFLISILATSVRVTTARPGPRDPHGRYRSGSLSQREEDATLPSGWELDSACVSDAPAPNRLLSWSDTPTGMTIYSCLSECVSFTLVNDRHYLNLPFWFSTDYRMHALNPDFETCHFLLYIWCGSLADALFTASCMRDYNSGKSAGVETV